MQGAGGRIGQKIQRSLTIFILFFPRKFCYYTLCYRGIVP